jgi:hypothetical protein
VCEGGEAGEGGDVITGDGHARHLLVHGAGLRVEGW